MRPLRLAHRGDWRAAPEDSIDAMRAALAVPGCDGLEFDVRFSRDGSPVLLHDSTLERVQGVPDRVESLGAEELARHGIPSLAAVLRAVGREPFLDVELKAPPTNAFIDVLATARADGPGSGRAGIASQTAGLYRAAISSFDPEILTWIEARRPGWPRWLNAWDLGGGTIARAVGLSCEAVAASWRSIDRQGIERAREAGLDVVAWTVRRRSTYARLAGIGVTAICVEAAALDG